MNKLDLEETTRRFHYIYEQVAKEYGYKTREDTKELDFNSPNGMTMLKTVEMITTPYLDEINELQEKNKKLITDYRMSIEKRVKLEQRIDKGIEYIENNVLSYIDEDGLESITDKEENELLNILRGEDKELRGDSNGKD